MLTADQKKYCPGLIHLRAQLRKMLDASTTKAIRVFDGEDVQHFNSAESGIIAASNYAAELDGMVYYSIGKATIAVIYDGPYGDENAAEIVNDMNEFASEILNA